MTSTMRQAKRPQLCGIWGRPFIDLEHLIAPATLAEVDREVTRGLVDVEHGQTGATLKWMGVVAPWMDPERAAREAREAREARTPGASLEESGSATAAPAADPFPDAMRVIERFTIEEWRELVALGDDGDGEGGADESRWREMTFGDETERPFSARQIRWLTMRHGVYFPWKVCVHLLENDSWDDKHSAVSAGGTGKGFAPLALAHFPRTVDVIRALPFSEIGRVVIFGLHANDHAPAHRDSEPGQALSIAQSISIDPRGDKRFYVASGPDDHEQVVVDKRVYWFNDMDWHGVHADPFFRYSIRIDGKLTPPFLRDLERRMR